VIKNWPRFYFEKANVLRRKITLHAGSLGIVKLVGIIGSNNRKKITIGRNKLGGSFMGDCICAFVDADV
jgi:hypothetical protein